MADLSMVFDLLARDRASSEVDKVADSMKGAGDQADGFADKLSGMWGGVAAGAAGAGLAVGAAFWGAIDNQSANTKLAAQLGLNPEDAATAGKVAGDLYAHNYGDSLESVNDAVRSVVQNMTVDVNDADLSTITGKALDLASAFGVDVGDATKTVSNLIETGLASNAQDALDIVTSGFQSGNDAAGDWLDTLNEYSVQFGKFGISGAEASNLISQGMQAGARDSDLVADAIKEFSLRAVDGSKTTADGFSAIGLNAQDMAAKIAAGGPTAHDALEQTITSLRNMTDPVAQAQAAAALFGSQAEDLGGALYALDPASAAAAGSVANVQGASDRLDATLSSGVGPTLETLKRGLQTAATDGAGALIAGFTQGSTDAGGWQGTLQNLAATLSGVLQPAFDTVSSFVTGTLGPALSGLFQWMSDHQTTVEVIAGLITGVLGAAFGVWATRAIFAAAQNAIAWVSAIVSSNAGAAGVELSALQVVASWVLMGVQAMFGALRMAAAWLIALGPIGLVIAAVVGIVALIVANWDTVVRWTTTAWQAVVGAVGAAWDWIKGAVSAALGFLVNIFLNFTGPGLIIKHWQAIKDFTVGAWNAVVGFVTDAWSRLTGAISSGVSSAVSFVAALPGKIVGAIGNLGSTLYGAGSDLINGLINGAKSILRNIGRLFLDVVPSWIRGPFESALGIASPSRVFAGYGVNIGQGLINGLSAMRPAIADELATLADTQAFDALANVGVAGGGGGVPGYAAPAYDMPGAAGTGGSTTRVVNISGVASPEQVAAEVARAQRTDEFLTGV